MATFCTISDLVAFLQVAIADDSASALRAIAEASASIQNYCRQQLEEVEDDEHVFDVADGCRRLFLPELPVSAVSLVIEDDEELAEDDDYKLGNYGILYRIGRPWVSGVQMVAVTYTHGYPVGDYGSLPDDIVSVCVRAASRAYQAGLRGAMLAGVPGVSGQTIGDYSVQYSGELSGGGTGMDGGTLGVSGAPLLLPSERRILNRYRMP